MQCNAVGKTQDLSNSTKIKPEKNWALNFKITKRLLRFATNDQLNQNCNPKYILNQSLCKAVMLHVKLDRYDIT